MTSWQTATQVLGDGSYGVVRACTATVGAARRQCAQKRFKADVSDEGVSYDAIRELQPMCTIPPHPCVMHLEALVHHEDSVYVLLPLYDYNLAQFVRRHHGSGLPELLLRAVAVLLLHALTHLHAHGFMHRDIKMENALVSTDGRVVLGDLGMCRHVGSTTPEAGAVAGAGAATGAGARILTMLHQTANVCTLWTRAPEVVILRTGGPTGMRYTTAMDVWSVAATMLACARGEYAITASCDGDFLVNVWRVVGRPPRGAWPELDRAADEGGNAFAALPPGVFAHYGRPAAVARELRAATTRPTLSDVACDFLARTLEVVPARRLTVDAALAHPFLAGMPLDVAIAAVAGACARLTVPRDHPLSPAAMSDAVSLAPAETLWVSGRPRPSPPPPDYLARHTDINARMRAILLDWLWTVGVKFKLHPCVFFDTVQLLDRYLHARPAMQRSKLQLGGIAAMSLCSKMHEVCVPDSHDWVCVCDKAYTTSQLHAAELDVLGAAGGAIVPQADGRLYAHALTWGASRALLCALAAVCVHVETMRWTLEPTPCAAAAAAAFVARRLELTAAEVVPAVPPADAAACFAALHAAVRVSGLRSVWKVRGPVESYDTRAAFHTLFA